MISRTLALAGVVATVVFPQSAPTFEVASVKLNTANGRVDTVPQRSANHVTMHNTQPTMVFYYAYHLRHSYQVVGDLGLPAGWNWYDIEANVEGNPSDEELRLMFQNLLADRFKLKVHRETREMTVYNLLTVKGGSKLTPASDDFRLHIDGKTIATPFSGTLMGRDGQHLMGKGATMQQLVNALASSLGGPVVDQTGLQGAFDYDILYARDSPAKSGEEEIAPSLPSAIQSLGLKLERGKGPVEVLVIDHIEKPTAN